MHKVIRSFIDQHVIVIELRHIFNCVVDDNGDAIGVEKECEIFNRVVSQIQQEVPDFRLTIINCGLKIVGKPHIIAMLDATLEAQKYCDFVTGFDMVNEEDAHPPIEEFAKEILEARAKSEKGLDVFLHAGESFLRENDQMIDAILLGTKRIGHGYNLI